MKKVLLFLLITTFLLVLFSVPTKANEEIKVYLDDKKIEFDQPPVTINDRTLVPMRALFEALGADVKWDEEKQIAEGVISGISVRIPIDENYIIVNHVKISIDSPAKIINDRTLIPLRVVSESLGVEVNWDDNTKTINMKNKNIIQVVESDSFPMAGMIQNDKLNGYGTIYYPEGNIHSSGLYIDNVLQEGIYYWATGEMFIGKFNNWKLNGEECFYSYGGMVVCGKFENNLPVGDIVIMYENGDYYSGQTNGFIRNGKGLYQYDNGSYYIGTWVNDEPKGEGMFVFEDGESYYMGNFFDGWNNLNGTGRYYDATTNMLYEGKYQNSKKNGLFTIYLYNEGIVVSAMYRNDELTSSIPIGKI